MSLIAVANNSLLMSSSASSDLAGVGGQLGGEEGGCASPRSMSSSEKSGEGSLHESKTGWANRIVRRKYG